MILVSCLDTLSFSKTQLWLFSGLKITPNDLHTTKYLERMKEKKWPFDRKMTPLTQCPVFAFWNLSENINKIVKQDTNSVFLVKSGKKPKIFSRAFKNNWVHADIMWEEPEKSRGERVQFWPSSEVIKVLEGKEHDVKGVGEENFSFFLSRHFGWSNNCYKINRRKMSYIW